MNKTAKALLIPVAAFAVTATGVSAFNSDLLESAGLDENQIAAFEEARELREDGDREAARDVLIEAGVDIETMQNVREAMCGAKQEHHEAIHEAVEAGDYDAFLVAIADSPLADIITSEADFERFVEAQEYREAGKYEAAREIMDDLGFQKPERGHGHGFARRGDDEGRGPGNFGGFHGGLE